MAINAITFLTIIALICNVYSHGKSRSKFRRPKPRAPECEYYQVADSDIQMLPLPSGDTSDRNIFPDPNTYSIDDITISVCNTKNGDMKVKFKIKGTGFALEAPTTIWMMFADTSHPIFQYTLPYIPLSSTTASFSNGRNVFDDVNSLQILNDNGDFRYSIAIDYNPLLPNEAPLTNDLEVITQASYCDIDISDYPNLCQKQYKSSGEYTNVAREFLREFDSNGQQLIDENGNAKIVRAPSELATMVFVTHIDLLTHGIEDGTIVSDPIGNCKDEQFNCDDYYMIAMVHLPKATKEDPADWN